jgi:hypothetical protein
MLQLPLLRQYSILIDAMSDAAQILLRRAWLQAGLVLCMLLLVQLGFSKLHPRAWKAQLTLGSAPSADWLKLASLGELTGTSRALSLYTQSFDAQAGQAMAIRDLDLEATLRWLALSGELAPTSPYPTFLASRIYASVAGPRRARQLLDWVASRYAKSPATQWPWLAHAVYVAEHELHDKQLARGYANLLRTAAGNHAVPEWARSMEVFLLQDLNEFEAAQALLGGLIDSGQIKDQRALQVMIEDLNRIKSRFLADQRSNKTSARVDLDSDRPLPRQAGEASPPF